MSQEKSTFLSNSKKTQDQYGVATTLTSSGAQITSYDNASADIQNNSSVSNSSSSSTDSSSSSSTDSSSSSSKSKNSSLLEGTMTFEELVGEICKGIDLCFIVKRGTVVVTDYETLYAEAKYLRDNYSYAVASEDIGLWQLEDGSYELEVAEYGFYNTVIVNYQNGSVRESYEDYVRVYGEVPIVYDEPNLDKSSAIMKAKAYLAAHVRDFEMSVKATLLHDADIDIGDIVTLDNPLTLRDAYRKNTEGRDPEYFFVIGNSIEWDGSGPILNNIELRYGAKSPNKKEVPESGASYSNSVSNTNIDKAIAEVGKQWSYIGYCHSCQTSECVKQTGCGDCWGASDLISCELENKGVTTRIMQYPTSASERHRSVQYLDNTGQWVNFPYRQYGFNTLFNDTNGITSGVEVSKNC